MSVTASTASDRGVDPDPSSADSAELEEDPTPAPEPVPLPDRLQSVHEWVNHTFGPLGAAALAPDAATATPGHPVDLYDSGATHHMSPFREDFTSFTEIPARPLNAANQQQFNAMGVGKMTVPVPNAPSKDTPLHL
ncbi:hypothetical protein C8Q76DRAFT_622877, partial [Earliella scabrosa]